MSSPQKPLIVSADELAIEQAAEVLRRGGLVGVPTETVYGLAANAFDVGAVQQIFTAKGRPSKNPLIVHLASSSWLSRVAAWPLSAEQAVRLQAIEGFWPGPLTVVLPKHPDVPSEVTAGRETVAVRIPSHPVMQRLLQRCDFALAAPSANRSAAVSPTSAAHVAESLGAKVDLILDGGPCQWGIESTIVSLQEEPPRLLRPGGITVEQLAEAWHVSPEELLVASRLPASPDRHSIGNELAEASESLLAPGMMKEHYAPATPLRLLSQDACPASGTRIGRVAFRSLSADEQAAYASVIVLSDSGDLAQVAQGLFAALRELDECQLDEIWCDTCSSEGLGRAIMDRLQRAAAKSAGERR